MSAAVVMDDEQDGGNELAVASVLLGASDQHCRMSTMSCRSGECQIARYGPGGLQLAMLIRSQVNGSANTNHAIATSSTAGGALEIPVTKQLFSVLE